MPTLPAVVDLAEPGGGVLRRSARGTRARAAYERGIPIAARTDTSYTPATLSSIAGEIRRLAELALSNSTRYARRPRPARLW